MAEELITMLSAAERVRRQNRKRIKVRVRFSAEYVGEDLIRYTCRRCGFSKIQRPGKSKYALSHDGVRKLAAYQDQGGGAGGICSRCTKRKRDRQYPQGWGPLGPQRAVPS